MRTSPHLFANTHAAGSEVNWLTNQQQVINWPVIISIFVNPNGNKLTCTNCWEMRTHKQVFQEAGKKRENMRKHCCSKKSSSYEIYARTSKANHRVFQLRVRLLLGSFPFFITCSSLHGNCAWRLGASSIRDASSNRRLTVESVI